MSKKVPVSLIIDDSGPVNMTFFHDLGRNHELLIPPDFLKKFVKVAQKNCIRGKFSFVPYPAGLGRVDEKVNLVPNQDLKAYLRIVREEIQPCFSITPEILTHYRAFDLKSGRTSLHVFEDVLFSTASAEEIRDYVGFALTVLQNAGLDPTGVTSPWLCGIDNEENYSKGIGCAFRKFLKKDRCFYFLHCRDEVKKPTLMCDSPETGQVISIPDNTFDAFWGTDKTSSTLRQAKAVAKANIDNLLSEDGKSGWVRDLYERKLPITLISHWQSLFSDGRNVGLEGLDYLVQRINRVFGNQIEWMSFAEMSELWEVFQ
ncbi:MAG: hypothetical protein J5898_08910 [Lachnospiraceae bacterium]|nr:hypothetical protein [Lachnospiraceae bacterium]MBO4630727.1 hypothetical protein [Lentisphaeria bacterium]